MIEIIFLVAVAHAGAEVVEAEVANAEVANTEVVQAEVVEAEVVQAEVANAEVVQAEVADTEVVEAEVADGAVADAEVIEAAVADDEVAGVDLPSAEMRWMLSAHHFLLRYAPDEYFGKGQAFLRGSVREWERVLKAVLVSWASKHSSHGLHATEQVLKQLKAVSDWESTDTSGTSSRKWIKPWDFYTMLKGLNQKEMLPILTFSFDRRNCERLASKPFLLVRHCM